MTLRKPKNKITYKVPFAIKIPADLDLSPQTGDTQTHTQHQCVVSNGNKTLPDKTLLCD